MEMNADQIRERNGPLYLHWAMRSILAGHRALALAAERDGLDTGDGTA